MDVHSLLQLAQDVVKITRLHAFGGRLGVAVHGITDPHNLDAALLHRLDQARQPIGDA